MENQMCNKTTSYKPADRLAGVSEYYFSRKLKEVAQMNAEGKDIISLGIGSPDMPPSEKTIETLCQAAQDPDGHGYMPYVGIPELRQAFARWYKKWYDVDLDPQTEIQPLIGSKEGILHVTLAFVNPGDQVLVPNPGYPTYTGAQATPELYERLVDFARRRGIVIVNDNPYSFILNDHPLSILAVPGARDCCIEFNSMSKSHNMPGWRIGMLASNAQFVQWVLKVKSNIDSGMFRAMQLAAATALDAEQEWYDGNNANYRRRRALAEDIMHALGCTFDTAQAGMFLWGRIPDTYNNVEELTERVLHEARVFLTPGFIFGTNGRPPGRGPEAHPGGIRCKEN